MVRERTWVAGGNCHYIGTGSMLVQVKWVFTIGTHSHLPNWNRSHQNWNWTAISNRVLSQRPVSLCMSIPFSSFSLITSEFLMPQNSRSFMNTVAIWVPVPHELLGQALIINWSFLQSLRALTGSSFQIRWISNTYQWMGYSSHVSSPGPISYWKRSCYSTN